MKFIQFIAAFAPFLFYQNSLAASLFALPNFLSAALEGHPSLVSNSTQPYPPPSPLNLLSNITSLTSSNALGAIKPRPEDPSEYDLPGTSLSLEFSHYGPYVPMGQMMLLFLQTVMQAFDNVLGARRRDVPLQQDERFEAPLVYMLVLGRPKMTWTILRHVLEGIVGFMIEHGTLATNVRITRDGEYISNIVVGRTEAAS